MDVEQARAALKKAKTPEEREAIRFELRKATRSEYTSKVTEGPAPSIFDMAPDDPRLPEWAQEAFARAEASAAADSKRLQDGLSPIYGILSKE